MVYEKVQKDSSSWNPAFQHQKSESLFRSRPFSIPAEADTDSAQEQEIPAYSRADRDAISAKLLKSMDGNVQSQTKTQSQKPKSEESPAFDHHKSESFFRPRPFSIQPQADTEESEAQEIPTYTRFDRDAISANLLKTMGANVQTQAETEVQKSSSESEELDSDEMSNETETLQRTSESGEAGDDDDNSANGGAIQRHGDNSESERHSQGMEAEESDEEMSLEAGAIQRQEELEEDPEDDVKSVQGKLSVGAPGDKYEQEADSVAAQVMSMSVAPTNSVPIQRQGEEEEQDPSVQRSSLADSITPLVQRLREEQEEPLQAKSLLQRAGNGNALAGSNVESQLNGSKGGGSPLPNEVRSFMEPRFGADFSSVRVHTDSTAVQMNKELGAQAFAHGSDIYYGAGKSPGNNELTAHELTHTIQQGGAVRLNKQVQRQAKEEEQETLQAKELSNHQGEVTLNKQVQPAETLVAKALPGDASQLSLNKELRLKPEATAEETEAQPIQAKQYTSLDVSSVSPRIQGDFLGIPTSIEEAKRKILSPVAQLATRIPGYSLLTVLLGKDPINEAPVERNGTNLIRGVLSLVPKGQEFFANLQQSGAIDKAYNWFNEQITKLNLTWGTIKGLFKKAWDSVGMSDLVSPSGAFEKIKNVFTEPIGRIKTFAVNAGTKVMEFVFEGVMGGGGAKVMGIIRSAGGVFNTIVSDPVKFIGNLVGAVKGGFQKFSGNINTHLKTGLVGWLFGALAGTGLALPAQFDLKGIVSLVLQVLGLTYQRMRGMLVKLIGEPKVAKLEKVFDFLMMIVTQGLGAAWQKITEFTGGLQEMVMGGIREWVQNSIITAAITKLLSMFNPAGAVIQAVMAIYNTVMFFIERGSQIAALGEAVFASIGTIAAGNIAGAATYVEQTMGRTLPVMISFLARLIGLGGISEQIKNVIKKIQSPIETAMTKVANFVVEKGKSFLGRSEDTKNNKDGKSDERTQQQKEADVDKAAAEAEQIMEQQGATPDTVRAKLPELESKYRLKSAKLLKDSDSAYYVEVEINPKDKTKKRKFDEIGKEDALKKFGYEISSKKGQVQKPFKVASNMIAEKPTNKEEICYVANVPTAASDKSPQAIAQLYLNQGFKSPDAAKKRFGLVVGVNAYDSITKDNNKEAVEQKVQTNGWNNFRLGVLGFLWQAQWEKQGGGKADLGQVRTAYKSLTDQEKQAVNNYEATKLKTILPYDGFRETITQHNLTAQFRTELGAGGNEVYVLIADPDAVSLNPPPNKQQGDAEIPVQEMATTLFERYDKIIKEHTSKNGTPPAIISGGYEFRMKGLGGQTEDVLRSAANKLDMAIRQAMAKVNPSTVYFPEPNTIVRVLPGKDKIEAHFTSNQGTSEGQALLRNLRKKRNLTSKDAVFDLDAAIETNSERFTTTIDGKEVQLNINWIGGEIKELTEEHIKALFESSQTHAKKNYWIRRVMAAYPGSKKTVSGRGVAITDVYEHYFANELLGYEPGQLKQNLKEYTKLPNYGEAALKKETKKNLQDTDDYDPVIKIAQESAEAVKKFLMEVLSIE
ncbi:MAG TPA: DUF4157 domain-containing protein [Leptolyngbyaceae cyanobacterium]